MSDVLPLSRVGVRLIDVEHLLHWAFAQTGLLPFRNPSERGLAYNHGWTAIPRGANQQFQGSEIALQRALDEDAAAVLAAVQRLPAEIRNVVRACAMSGIRPNWMEGIEPKLVERRVSHRKVRKKKKGKRGKKVTGRSHVERVWEPCSPETILIVREIYAAWHAALSEIATKLGPDLKNHEISGLAAPATPWDTAVEKTA